MPRRNDKPTRAIKQEREADRLIQALALVALVATLAIDAFSTDFTVPDIVYWALLGTAVGKDVIQRLLAGVRK